MTDPEHTEELARRARADPDAAFGELYERVAPAVCAWAALHLYAPLRARLDPEDILQEVSCRAFERFDSYDPQRGEFRAWVFGIARNVLLQALRHMGSAVAAAGPLLDTQGLAGLPDTATSITRRVARNDALRKFLERVEKLPDNQRRLLVHRGLEGLPHAEVGRLLGLEPKTAAKRWDRLKQQLNQELGVSAFLAA